MRVLITGMSGTGKSAVVRALAARGHRAIDLDDDGWSAWAPADGDPTGARPGHDWCWREDRVAALLAEATEGPLFVSGCAPNMTAFLPRFERVVLLSAPADVLVRRLATRAGNDYGRRPEELAAVLRNLREVEPRLRRVATHEVDATAPLQAVVDEVERVAGAGGARANASAGGVAGADAAGPPSAGVELAMVRPDLAGLPAIAPPAGYAVRAFEAGDEAAWVRIQAAADRYNDVTAALFRREFGTDRERLRVRQRFLVAPDGEPIGTATAWFGADPRGRPAGRVHWVAIAPAFQGLGLAKPLLADVCGLLRELGHERAYLTTASRRVAAIGLYSRFGFVPEVRGPEEEAAWAALRGGCG